MLQSPTFDPANASSSNSEPSMPENARECPIGENGLNERHLAAIELLVLGKSLAEVSRTIQIDPKTLYRWRQNELFQCALERRRRELWSTVAGRVQDLIHPSLEVLAEDLGQRYDRARFRAASAVLRMVDWKRTLQLKAET
jgi:hypothetical protein